MNPILKAGNVCHLKGSAKRWWRVAIQRCLDIRRLPFLCFFVYGSSQNRGAYIEVEADTGRPDTLAYDQNCRGLDFPILQLHHEILAPLRPLSGEWVFPFPKSETDHIARPERLKYNPHLHRRTLATVITKAGVVEEIVWRLLNHTPLSIKGQRYARPSLSALRPSMEVGCDEILNRISR